MSTRWFVAAGRGTAMLFGVRGTRVFWTSPQYQGRKNVPLSFLRAQMRSQGRAFYEVAR